VFALSTVPAIVQLWSFSLLELCDAAGCCTRQVAAEAKTHIASKAMGITLVRMSPPD